MFNKIGETLHGMIKWECNACGSVYTTLKRKPKTYVAKTPENLSWAGNTTGCKFCWNGEEK